LNLNGTAKGLSNRKFCIIFTVSDHVFTGSVIVPSAAGSSSQIWEL